MTEEMIGKMASDVHGMVVEMLGTAQPGIANEKKEMFATLASQLAGKGWEVETRMRSTDNGMVYILVSLNIEVDGNVSWVDFSNTGVVVHVDCMHAYNCYESIECMEIRYGTLWVERAGIGGFFHVDLPKSKKEETA